MVQKVKALCVTQPCFRSYENYTVQCAAVTTRIQKHFLGLYPWEEHPNVQRKETENPPVTYILIYCSKKEIIRPGVVVNSIW